MLSASNAVKVVLGVSPKTRTQLIGFNTGMLLSGFFMGFWLPSVASSGLPADQYSWVVLAGALGPGIGVAAIAAKPQEGQIHKLSERTKNTGSFASPSITKL